MRYLNPEIDSKRKLQYIAPRSGVDIPYLGRYFTNGEEFFVKLTLIKGAYTNSVTGKNITKGKDYRDYKDLGYYLFGSDGTNYGIITDINYSGEAPEDKSYIFVNKKLPIGYNDYYICKYYESLLLDCPTVVQSTKRQGELARISNISFSIANAEEYTELTGSFGVPSSYDGERLTFAFGDSGMIATANIGKRIVLQQIGGTGELNKDNRIITDVDTVNSQLIISPPIPADSVGYAHTVQIITNNYLSDIFATSEYPEEQDIYVYEYLFDTPNDTLINETYGHKLFEGKIQEINGITNTEISIIGYDKEEYLNKDTIGNLITSDDRFLTGRVDVDNIGKMKSLLFGVSDEYKVYEKVKHYIQENSGFAFNNYNDGSFIKVDTYRNIDDNNMNKPLYYGVLQKKVSDDEGYNKNCYIISENKIKQNSLPFTETDLEDNIFIKNNAGRFCKVDSSNVTITDDDDGENVIISLDDIITVTDYVQPISVNLTSGDSSSVVNDTSLLDSIDNDIATYAEIEVSSSSTSNFEYEIGFDVFDIDTTTITSADTYVSCKTSSVDRQEWIDDSDDRPTIKVTGQTYPYKIRDVDYLTSKNSMGTMVGEVDSVDSTIFNTYSDIPTPININAGDYLIASDNSFFQYYNVDIYKIVSYTTDSITVNEEIIASKKYVKVANKVKKNRVMYNGDVAATKAGIAETVKIELYGGVASSETVTTFFIYNIFKKIEYTLSLNDIGTYNNIYINYSGLPYESWIANRAENDTNPNGGYYLYSHADSGSTSTIQNPIGVIEATLRNTTWGLSRTNSDIDLDSFNRASIARSDWKTVFQLQDQVGSEELLEDMCYQYGCVLYERDDKVAVWAYDSDVPFTNNYMEFDDSRLVADSNILDGATDFEIEQNVKVSLDDTMQIISGKDDENYIGIAKNGAVFVVANNKSVTSNAKTMVLRCSAGRFNFSWNNASGRLWTFPNGTVLYSDGTTPISTSRYVQPDVIIPAGGGFVILESDSFSGNYQLKDNDTDAVYIGDLSDIDVSYYLRIYNCPNITGDLSDINVSYYLDLATCPNITGDLSDLPPLRYFLDIRYCTNITGALPVPTASTFRAYKIYLSGCTGIAVADSIVNMASYWAGKSAPSGAVLDFGTLSAEYDVSLEVQQLETAGFSVTFTPYV